MRSFACPHAIALDSIPAFSSQQPTAVSQMHWFSGRRAAASGRLLPYQKDVTSLLNGHS
jgi:hypothetical protein